MHLQVKNRWAGKTIVDLFAEEFKGRPYEYYVCNCMVVFEEELLFYLMSDAFVNAIMI